MSAPLRGWPEDEPSDPALLMPWEADFVASIDSWEGELTPAQKAKLAEVEQLLEESPRSMARVRS